MDMQRGTTDDGLRFVRQGSDRITSWDGRTWRAEYLEYGGWHAYPTFDSGPGSLPGSVELCEEGRRVLAVLKAFA